MARLLTVIRERELSRVLPHQVLESLQRYNLSERYMHRLSPGFHAKNFCRFVRQTGIQPYRRQCRSHVPALNLCIYNVAESYVHGKLFSELVKSDFIEVQGELPGWARH